MKLRTVQSLDRISQTENGGNTKTQLNLDTEEKMKRIKQKEEWKKKRNELLGLNKGEQDKIKENKLFNFRNNMRSGYQYSMILNLPIIIKERDLLDRKDTINTFRHLDQLVDVQVGNKRQTRDSRSLLMMKKKDGDTGKIRVNEFWSEKYNKLILKESKIMNNIQRIEQIQRQGINNLIQDLRQKVQTDSTKDEFVQSIINTQVNLRDHMMTQNHISEFRIEDESRHKGIMTNPYGGDRIRGQKGVHRNHSSASSSFLSEQSDENSSFLVTE